MISDSFLRGKIQNIDMNFSMNIQFEEVKKIMLRQRKDKMIRINK